MDRARYWRDIVFLCNTCLLLRWIPTVLLCLIIGNTSHDHFNASIYVTLILEPISYLNFRLSIQTKIKFLPRIEGILDFFSTIKNYLENLTIFGSPFDNYANKYKWEKNVSLVSRPNLKLKSRIDSNLYDACDIMLFRHLNHLKKWSALGRLICTLYILGQ